MDGALRAAVPGFVMADFLRLLADRPEAAEGDVFDLLLTFSDFAAFKQDMALARLERDPAYAELVRGASGADEPAVTLGIMDNSFGLVIGPAPHVRR